MLTAGPLPFPILIQEEVVKEGVRAWRVSMNRSNGGGL